MIMDWIIRKGNIHDSRVSHGMVDSVRNFSYILADSAYDTSDIYDYVFENTHTLSIIDTNRRRGIVPDQFSLNRKIGIVLTYVYGNMADGNMIPVLNAAPWLSSTAQGDFLGS